jgi:hypothetical protein
LDNKAENAGELEQISFGLNYRPIEDTVFKISYQYMPKSFNPSSGQRIHDSALVISAAAYFFEARGGRRLLLASLYIN